MNNQEDLWNTLHFYRFGVSTLTLTFGSCLGSVAVLCILANGGSNLELVLTAIATMFANAMVIGQAPIKINVFSFLTSVVINTLLILLNMLI